MHKFIIIIAGLLFLSSCKVFKPATDSRPVDKTNRETLPVSTTKENVAKEDEAPVVKKRAKKNINYDPVSKSLILPASNTESVSLLQMKYNQLLDQEVETMLNEPLFRFIDDWWGTPYHMGGLTKNGVDCSGFVFTCFITVYKIELPRTAYEQRQTCEKISKADLQEGDLVFFNTRGGTSHVGIYLSNNKFVHASTSGGVMISDLNEEYWSKKYLASGRVPSRISH